MTTAQDGSKIVSLTHRPSLPPGNAPGTQQTQQQQQRKQRVIILLWQHVSVLVHHLFAIIQR